MAPLQRGREDHRWAEGARYRSARWASGRSGSGNFDAVPQLAAEAEGSGSAEEGQRAWDGRRWRLDRSECHGAYGDRRLDTPQKTALILENKNRTRRKDRAKPLRTRYHPRRNVKPIATKCGGIGAQGSARAAVVSHLHNARISAITGIDLVVN